MCNGIRLKSFLPFRLAATTHPAIRCAGSGAELELGLGLRLDRAGLSWAELAGLSWAGWAGLGWAGAGLSWAELAGLGWLGWAERGWLG